MKRVALATVVALLAGLTPTAFAQTTDSPANAPSQATTPAEFDKEVARMQEQMAKMQEQMRKIQQTKDPQERQRLLQEHWATMQGAMTMMHGAWGGMMGCCGAGGRTTDGPMMGGHRMGPMMWGNYQNLTPEQLKQRQYMMDRWMPMQQMMMDQMMQHQHWMMQPAPPSSPPQKQ